MLGAAKIKKYFSYLCNRIYNTDSVLFYEFSLTSVKGRKITYDKNGNLVFGKPFEFNEYLDKNVLRMNPEIRNKVLTRVEKEIPPAKKDEVIDFGFIDVACGDGSIKTYHTIAVKVELEPEEIVLFINAEVSKSHNEPKLDDKGCISLKNWLSMTSSQKFTELVKVYLKDWSVNKIYVENDGITERALPYKWDVYKKNYFDFVRKEDRDRYYFYTSKEFLKQSNKGETYKFFYRSKNLSANGKLYWYSSTIKIEKDYFTMYTVDVSDEINRMYLLEKRNTRYLDCYKTAIVSDAIAFYEFNLTRNRIVGKPLQRIGKKRISMLDSLGLSKNCTYTDFIEANSWNMSGEERKIYMSKMNIKNLMENFNKGEYESWFDMVRKNYDGSPFWTRTSVILIKDEYTKDINGLCVVKNITDIHAAEEENIYKMEVINGLSEEYSNIFIVSRDFKRIRPVRISERTKGFFIDVVNGTSYTDALELYIETSVFESDRDMMRAAFSEENVLQQLRIRESYYVNFRSYINNKLEYFKLKVVRIGPSNDIKDFLFGFVNVDEEIQHEMEQKRKIENALYLAESANRAKTRFLSNMSHDIRTPMNAIIGFTNLAESHLEDIEAVHDYLIKIKSNSNHLLSLINDVLDMSRIESGKLKVHPAVCSLDSLTKSLRDIILPQASAENIMFTIEEQNVEHRNFICDSLRLNQIFINIIGNSVKFTNPEGKIVFTITELPVENKIDEEGKILADTVRFEFKIRDNGIGMSEEFQKHIFEPFSRENNAKVDKIQGTGLGLSITKNLVDLMGGTISVKSKLNEGTETRVVFEFEKISKPQVQETKNVDDEIDVHEYAGAKLLLVEDNAFNREIALTLLQDHGFLVECAENGKIAVDMVREKTEDYYSIILMDVMMPVMNGFEAAKAIRKLENPIKNSIPIIAMTANAFEEDKKNSLAAGMDDYISKPFDVKDLLKKIKTQLRNKNDYIYSAQNY